MLSILLFALACTRATPPAGPVPTAPSEVQPAAEPAPRVVLFVRHAEKAKDGTPDPPLTEAGEARASCLVAELGAPDLLLASPYRRTQATLAPLAAARGVQPEILDAGATALWVERLRALPPGGRAVVAAHSNTVPAIVAALGGQVPELDAEGFIPETEFDRVIEVELDAQGQATRTTQRRACNP